MFLNGNDLWCACIYPYGHHIHVFFFRFQSDEFIIRHFAGDVAYGIAGFIEKNNDSLHEDLLDLLRTSENPFLKNLFSSEKTPNTAGYIKGGEQKEGSKGRAAVQAAKPGERRGVRPAGGGKVVDGPRAMSNAYTVSINFRKQLEDLTSTLKQTEPHYIKCVKPNTVKAAGGFSSR